MVQRIPSRLILVEPSDSSREELAGRLQAQGWIVSATGDPAEAANFALANPPAAIIADLWMPGISGVQLCRLLRSEPATANIAVILRATGDDPRARFFAEKAGADDYVAKGRIGQLVRSLNRAITDQPESDGFFMQIDETVDIRERIAHHLDRSLFESMLSSEVRALGTCESFERLFDLFSQFASQVTSYRWLALRTERPSRLALHTHPNARATAETEARLFLECEGAPLFCVVDEDATDDDSPAAMDLDPVVAQIDFGGEVLGSVAMAPLGDLDEATQLIALIARDLGGPVRMADLVQQSQRLASYDPLTGIMNRRAFVKALEAAVEAQGIGQVNMSLFLLDIDHFKSINDGHGHAAGDDVLAAVGACLMQQVAAGGTVARWGGEEFVLALPTAEPDKAARFGEQIREAIESMQVKTEDAEIPVTASIGYAIARPGEALESAIERADQAMYAAKVGGRNRVRGADLAAAA